MAKGFEKFALENYVSALKAPAPSPDLVVAAARYIGTRKITGHEAELREALTAEYKGPIAKEIAEACVDALLATAENRMDTAAFLALVAAEERPMVSAPCEAGVKVLGASAHPAILQELVKPHPPDKLRRLARLLVTVSKVQSPEPITFWQNADIKARRRVAEIWQQRIAARLSAP